MMLRWLQILVVGALSLGAVPAVASCQDAVNSYNSAIDDIATNLKRYTSCLQTSRGNDDCSSEFRRLRNAQNDFESAVSQHQNECRE